MKTVWVDTDTTILHLIISFKNAVDESTFQRYFGQADEVLVYHMLA
jgi:hypothetical protein